MLGEHGGYSDFFVPLGNVDDSWGTLAVGPFATAPPTSGELLANFRALSGKHGRLGYSGFVHYLSLRLSVLTLEGALRKNFERFLIGFSALLAEGAHVEQILGSLNPLRFKLADARQVEIMWKPRAR